MPCRTIVSWTTMINGYARGGCYADALGIFREMQVVGIEPDEISVISVLPACAQLGALEVGKWIHKYSEKSGFLKNAGVFNALVEMYAKCGCIDEAWGLFNQMIEKDVISWSTMIGGLANHGKGYAAIRVFEDMQKAGVTPNGVTFVGVLSACAHEQNNFSDPEIGHKVGLQIDYLGAECNDIVIALQVNFASMLSPKTLQGEENMKVNALTKKSSLHFSFLF